MSRGSFITVLSSCQYNNLKPGSAFQVIRFITHRHLLCTIAYTQPSKDRGCSIPCQLIHSREISKMLFAQLNFRPDEEIILYHYCTESGICHFGDTAGVCQNGSDSPTRYVPFSSSICTRYIMALADSQAIIHTPRATHFLTRT
jgi:hypothetical protein